MYKGSKIIAIVQARMGSTRLPGKVLLNLAGKPVLDHVVSRLQQSEYIDKTIVATTKLSNDDIIARWARDNDIEHYRGSEEDVLDRYHECSNIHPSRIVCRATADCPLIDCVQMDRAIKHLVDNRLDYVDMDVSLVPRGVCGEVFLKTVLDEVFIKAKEKYHREHVTYYIYGENGTNYRISSVEPPPWLVRDYRLTLDTRKDFDLLEKVFQELSIGNRYLDLREVIMYLDQNPDIAAINADIAQKPIK